MTCRLNQTGQRNSWGMFKREIKAKRRKTGDGGRKKNKKGDIPERRELVVQRLSSEASRKAIRVGPASSCTTMRRNSPTWQESPELNVSKEFGETFKYEGLPCQTRWWVFDSGGVYWREIWEIRDQLHAIQTSRYSLSPRNNKHPVQKLIWLSKFPNIASFIICELDKLFGITCFVFCDLVLCVLFGYCWIGHRFTKAWLLFVVIFNRPAVCMVFLMAW